MKMGYVGIMDLLILLLALRPLLVYANVTESAWGPWTDWSICSKTCGHGVVYRQRTCHVVESPDTDESKCSGDKKQFKTCMLEECSPDIVDENMKECSKLNAEVYDGKSYIWEPYRNPYKRCELSCKARGHYSYSSIQKTLSDGTPCKHDNSSFCLAGNCLAVGCDGILGSKTRLDQCGVCGGDGKSCRLISGIFTRSHLDKYGHNFITKIPKGACNINITEMSKSRNFIAIKISDDKYIINDKRQISHTGSYYGAGTEFNYYRNTGPSCPGECIYSSGPTNRSIDIEILYYHRNPGIIYQFTIPNNKVSTLGIPSPEVTTKTTKHRVRKNRNGRKHHRKHRKGNNKHRNKQKQPRQVKTDIDELNKEQSDDVVVGRSGSGQSSNDDRYIIRRRIDADRLNPRIQFGETPRYIPSARQGYQQQVIANSRLSHHRDQLPARYPIESGSSYDRQSVTGVVGQYVHNRVLPTEPETDLTLPNSYPLNNYNQVVPKLESHDTNFLDTSGLYSWTISGFTECSRSCGGGQQEPRVLCKKGISNVVVTPENCDPARKPTTRKVQCNTAPCPAEWHTGNWSTCSVTCGSGKHTRLVECQRRISPTLSISVSASLCLNQDRPRRTKSCDNEPCATWNSGPWSKCSVKCGHGQRRREVNCIDVKGQKTDDSNCGHRKPKEEEICDMGSCAQGWYHSKWSEECSSHCGRGYYTRNIYCAADDGSSLPDRKCSTERKPKTRKTCKSPKPCGGNWFAGPWNKCNATCGVGAITRGVVCMKELRSDVFTIVKDENCLADDKPIAAKPCEDLPPCAPTWYMTEYSQCTKTCGSGVKRREVKCLDSNLQPSLDCIKSKRPAERQSCNKESCKTANFSLQKDSGGDGCKDSNPEWCQFVKQARICGYSYYKKVCCKSCHSYL